MTCTAASYLLKAVFCFFAEPSLEALTLALKAISPSLELSFGASSLGAVRPPSDTTQPLKPLECGREKDLLLSPVKEAGKKEEAGRQGRG